MPSVDRRIVEMKFDNAAFERGASATMRTLDQLKAKMNFDGAAKGLSNINAAGKNIDMSHVGRGVDAVTAKFTALQVAAVAALSTIVSRATIAGQNLVKSFTVAPITQGFGEYELKMKSIQTILANTARHGTTLATVNDELKKLNEYSDKTIYNFAEMTKNASLFTASGMKIEEATTTIKGFSNAAAASGTGAEDAARAAYQLSQALNKGRITMEDWRSLSNAGMGNKNMQESLVQVASAMGTFTKKTTTSKDATANFTGSLEKGWLTADVMSTYLKAMSGDMTDAELAAKGLDAAQIKAIQSQAKMGLDAATKVRTFSALMGTLKESVASGWAESFELIFGNFEEATNVFTSLSSTIGGIISNISNARNKVLGVWNDMGGRAQILEGIVHLFKLFGGILRPIKEAFREIFPAKTGEDLFRMSVNFRRFVEGLRIGKETAENIKRTFAGVFAIFKIVTTIVGQLAKGFLSLFGTVGTGTGGLFAFTAVIGDFIVKIQQLLTESNFLQSVIAGIAAIIRPTVGLVFGLASAVGLLLTGDFGGFGEQVKRTFGVFGDAMASVWDRFMAFTAGIRNGFMSLADTLINFGSSVQNGSVSAISGLGAALVGIGRFFKAFSQDARGAIEGLIASLTAASENGRNFLAGFAAGGLSKILSVIDRLSAGFDTLREKLNLTGNFNKVNEGASQAAGKLSALSVIGGMLASVWDAITGAFSGLISAIGPVFNELGAFFETLIRKMREWVEKMDMSDAVSLMSTGFLVLLYSAITKFTSGIGIFVGNINGTFTQLTATLTSMQNLVRAQMIMQIAIAVGVLVAAIFVLAKIDPEGLKSALAALAAIFAQIAIMMKVVTMINPTSMLNSAAAMIAFAIAIRILASAIKVLGEMDPNVLIQGGIAIGVMMAALAGMVRVLNATTGVFAAAAGLALLAYALTALIVPLVIFERMPFGVIAEGLVAMALVVGGLGLAMRAFPAGMVAKAAGIVILAYALVILTGVLATLGLLPTDNIVKAILTLAAALAILVVATNLMSGALLGAAAMIIVAGAIAILVPAIAMLGSLSMETIGKGLLGLLGIMAVLVIGMYALTPVIVVLATFAAALKILSIAVLITAIGFGIFAAALGVLAVTGAAGFAVLMGAIFAFLNLLPIFAQQLGHAFIAFFLVMEAAAPKIARASLNIIIAILKAIRDKIGEITTLAIEIVENFINAIAAKLGPVIEAGVNFIISFIEGMAEAIRGNKERTGEAGADLAKAIVEGVISAWKASVGKLNEAARKLFSDMLKAIKDFLGISSPSKVFSNIGMDMIQGLINGIAGLAGALWGKVKELITGAINAIKTTIATLIALGRTIVTNIVDGIQAVAGMLYSIIRTVFTTMINVVKTIVSTYISIGRSIIEFIVNGVKAVASTLSGAVGTVIRAAISTAKSFITGAVDIGSDIVSGIARGIRNGLDVVKNAAKNLAKSALDSAKNFLGISSPSKEFMKLGRFVNEGFAKGMSDSKETIEKTYKQTTDLLRAAITAADGDIAKAKEQQKKLTAARVEDAKAIEVQISRVAVAKARLAELTNAKKKDNEAIQAAKLAVQSAENQLRKLRADEKADLEALRIANKDLTDAQKERAAAANAHILITAGLKEEKAALRSLATTYEDLTEKVKEAEDSLQDAIKTRDDYNRSISDQYDKLPDINKDTTLLDYVSNLEQKLVDTQQFSTAIQKLRDLGLNDDLYKEFLAKGVDALPFVTEILKGGDAAIQNLNALTTGLNDIANSLGQSASRSLYQAGVDAAQGLVNGLRSQLGAIQAEMAKIAAAMQAKIEQKLKIKSPSRVFAEIGSNSAKGLIVGLNNSTKDVGTAAGELGSEAVNSLQKSLSNLGPSLDGSIDMTPVIRPVMDLTDIQKSAGSIGALLAGQSVSVKSAYSSATAASQAYRNNLAAASGVESEASSAAAGGVMLIQNNYSPKALSAAEIYRNTNNQLSRAKGALTNA